MDADISFREDFFAFLLQKFEEMPDLGVAGTHYVEGDFHSFRDSYINVHHVNGQCQLFRRTCFQDIGGYVPIKGGGIDWVAVTTARMKGWRTRTFEEITCFHHRPMGTGGSSLLMARFKLGKEDYYLGGHPLWEFFRAGFQLKEKPYILGGAWLYAGYLWASLTRVRRPLSAELVEFHRAEQMVRLKRIFRRALGTAAGGNLKVSRMVAAEGLRCPEKISLPSFDQPSQ